RVYTNADLGKIERTRTATEEELASLRAHQFVAIPDRPAGPQVIVIGGSTAEGPFGPFYMPGREPLDNSPWFGGVPIWGYRIRGPVTTFVPNMSFPGLMVPPAFARGPLTAAPSARAPSGAVHRGRRQ
ncbi:MAG TPA: hypothetical protein VGY57_05510, partial [Vicinamibacterales bacterium]|nr:hypothetical protein [Vicinamibacterales bacterium]